MRTPYNKAGWNPTKASRFTDNGYVLVVQDTRGRFASAGDDSIFFTDGVGPNKDGYDTIEWIVGQAWSDGNVGMRGASAPGLTSYYATAAAHPALKCAVVGVAASSLYHDAAYPGGVYRMRMVTQWATKHGMASMLPLLAAHPRYDELWARADLPRHAAGANASIYHWGGWYDCMSRGTIRAFQALQERGGEGARGRQVLVIGPWSHGDHKPNQGELVYPLNSRDVDLGREWSAWFDSRLKGIPTRIDSVPAVRYYLMGDTEDSTAPGNLWRSADTWPPADVEPVSYYLQPGGGLALEPPDAESSSAGYDYDPRDPAPTKGGLNLFGLRGPHDQRGIESRPDVLTYTTPPLEEPVAVAGNVVVRLWASSSAPDTDFMARLCDVYPDGRSMLLLDGAVRGRYRNSLEVAERLPPGEAVELDVDLWDTAVVFDAGHRIRVDVSSSNSPRFRPNLNTWESSASDTVGIVAANTIYHDAAHPSAIIMPVIPARGP